MGYPNELFPGSGYAKSDYYPVYVGPSDQKHTLSQEELDYASAASAQAISGVVTPGYIDYLAEHPEDDVIYGNVRESSAQTSSSEIMSEREFAKYMTWYAHQLGLEADSTKYQRAYNDLLQAGLNPRLAIESLNGSGVSASSGYSYSQSQNKSQSETKSESISNSFSSSAIIAAIIAGVFMIGKAMI